MYKIGEWSFFPKESKLSSESSEIKLTAQSLAILYCFINNKNEIVSKELLIQECWGGRYVSDDAIRRSIKELRSILGCNAKSPTYIETIRKQGFRLIPEIVSVPEKQAEIAQVAIPFGSQKKLILSVLIILLLSVIFFLSTNQSTIPIISKQYSIVTHEEGFEDEYAVSTKNWSAYKADQPNSNKNSNNLIIRDEKNNIVLVISSVSDSEKAVLSKPVFSPSGNTLAYIDHNPEGTSINVISLKKNIGNLLHQIPLSQTDGLVVVEWFDEDSLYFSTSPNFETPLSIKLKNLTTLKQYHITSPLPGGRGDYFAKQCINGQLLILRNPDWSSTQIILYDSNKSSERLIKTLPESIYNADWSSDCQYIFLAMVGKSLAVIDLKTNEITSYDQFENITNVTTQSQYIYLNEGATFTNSIYTLSLTSNKKQKLTSSNGNNYLYAKMNSSNDFAFVSNRTGIPQIWLHVNGQERQLTQFTDKENIAALSWSLDDSYLLYVNGNKINKVLPNSGQDSVLFKSKGKIAKLIPYDAKKWLFTSVEQGVWQGFYYDVHSNETSLFNEMAVDTVFRNYLGEIYFSTVEGSIYQHSPNTLTPQKIAVLGEQETTWGALNGYAYLYSTATHITGVRKVTLSYEEQLPQFEELNVSSISFSEQGSLVFTLGRETSSDVKKYQYSY